MDTKIICFIPKNGKKCTFVTTMNEHKDSWLPTLSHINLYVQIMSHLKIMKISSISCQLKKRLTSSNMPTLLQVMVVETR